MQALFISPSGKSTALIELTQTKIIRPSKNTKHQKMSIATVCNAIALRSVELNFFIVTCVTFLSYMIENKCFTAHLGVASWC